MGRTYLPRGVLDKLVFFSQFADVFAPIAADFGFTLAEIDAITAAAADARESMATRDVAAGALRVAQGRAEEAVDAATAAVRSAVFRLQAAPGMTDAVRQ